MGGAKRFENKLDELFSTSSKTTGREQADITGLIGQYAHGNEPSHHMAYLYNYIDKPEKAQKQIRQILLNFYKNSADGLIGNEDCGQMSAWYVLSSMGFYPVCPGSVAYELGAPLFNSSTIHLENGKNIVLQTKNYTDKNYYVSRVLLNDKPYEKTSLNYTELPDKTGMMDGITVVFEMASIPKTKLPNTIPKKITPDVTTPFIVSPLINSASAFFKTNLKIDIKSSCNNCKTFYTTNGEMPSQKSTPYLTPLNLTETTTITAISINDKGDQSYTTTGVFYKMPHPSWKVILKSNYNKQYTAGGNDGIIDGLYGPINWRKGGWQGYQSQDFECIIDLGKLKSIQAITSNYLQDSRSWIVFPKQVEYFTSTDGITYSSCAIIKNDIPADDNTTQVHSFNFTAVSNLTTRYIKIKAKNYGVLPEWHQGKGGDAFIFVDEIDVK